MATKFRQLTTFKVNIKCIHVIFQENAKHTNTLPEKRHRVKYLSETLNLCYIIDGQRRII